MSETTTNVVELETTEAVEAAEEKKYTLRELGTKDVFLMSQILGKIGIKDFLGDEGVKKMSQMEDGMSFDEFIAQVGVEVLLNIVDVVLGNLQKCEKDIYTFLSHVSGMTTKEIEGLDMVTFTEMIVDVIKKEEFKGFIKVVSRLFK